MDNGSCALVNAKNRKRNMKILGVPKMKWHDGCCWLLLLSFSLVFALGNDNEQNISIREFPMNAIDSTTSSQAMSVVSNNAIDSAAQKQQQKSDSVEEIWAKETELAEREVERILLFGLGGSFPPPMPTGPVITPTMAPMGVTPDDCLNGRTEEQFLLDELTAITPAVDQLLNPAMPQGMAVNFILADSLVRNDVCAHPTLAQRYGLATFYFSTNGSSWNNNTAWLTEKPECDWFGVFCADDVHVSNLTMPSNNVSGHLPNEISTLFLLDRIEFFSNNVTGVIPNGISNISSLQVLDLESNKMSGLAFTWAVMNMSSLRQLFLSSNNFTGVVPSDIGVKMANLTDLWVAENELMGQIPESIGQLAYLSTLILYGNNLDGSLPASLGNLTNVRNLQLYRNIFDEAVPSSLFNMTNLKVLRLDQNFFTGTLSTAIGRLSQLTDLRINNNFFATTFPSTIGAINNLTFLLAGSNLLTGTIPNVFTKFEQLTDFDFSTNFFTGSIPDTIFASNALQRVYLSNNALTGKIPVAYSTTSSLVDLFLDSNLITGTIPALDTGALPDLNEFLLQNNFFNGTMPSSVCVLRTAGKLDHLVSDCGGAVPEIVCSFPDCCNRCFEGGLVSSQRRLSLDGELSTHSGFLQEKIIPAHDIRINGIDNREVFGAKRKPP